jgi:hypothetical protein
MNGYDLSRKFVDWAFENPAKIRPIHYAVFFFAIEHCNRLGWKKEFGFPSYMVMEAIGVKKHSTFSDAMKDLEDWGFLSVVHKAKNQYTANVIALCAMPKKGTARGRAREWHGVEQGNGTVTIDKPIQTTKQVNNETTEQARSLVQWLQINCPDVCKMKEPLTNEQAQSIIDKYPNPNFVAKTFQAMDNYKPLKQKNKSAYKTFLNWASRDFESYKEANGHQPQKKRI